jgi:hypothetical protein
LLLASYFFAARPPAPANDPERPVNVNYVFGVNSRGVQAWMPAWAWPAVVMAASPLISLPAHLLLERLAGRGPSKRFRYAGRLEVLIVASNDYVFVTHWQVDASPAEVYDVVIEGTDYVRWWPQVYLEVVETAAGDEHGLGKAARLLTKGWLPYQLRWQMRVVETHYPDGFTLDATGDFVGSGVWTFNADGPRTKITFDWRLRAEMPLLRRLSFVFKPFFSANHRWAMAKGQEGLIAELARRAPR